jgi:predicted transcriptional regulator
MPKKRSKYEKLLKKNPGQLVKELAKKLNMNRAFLAGYLKAFRKPRLCYIKKNRTY